MEKYLIASTYFILFYFLGKWQFSIFILLKLLFDNVEWWVITDLFCKCVVIDNIYLKNIYNDRCIFFLGVRITIATPIISSTTSLVSIVSRETRLLFRTIHEIATFMVTILQSIYWNPSQYKITQFDRTRSVVAHKAHAWKFIRI